MPQHFNDFWIFGGRELFTSFSLQRVSFVWADLYRFFLEFSTRIFFVVQYAKYISLPLFSKNSLSIIFSFFDVFLQFWLFWLQLQYKLIYFPIQFVWKRNVVWLYVYRHSNVPNVTSGSALWRFQQLVQSTLIKFWISLFFYLIRLFYWIPFSRLSLIKLITFCSFPLLYNALTILTEWGNGQEQKNHQKLIIERMVRFAFFFITFILRW